MTTLIKKPVPVSAVQWTGTNVHEVRAFAPGCFRVEAPTDEHPRAELLAGVEGAQGWVPLPVGHWVFGAPGDFWPVDHEYVLANYAETPTICRGICDTCGHPHYPAPEPWPSNAGNDAATEAKP